MVNGEGARRSEQTSLGNLGTDEALPGLTAPNYLFCYQTRARLAFFFFHFGQVCNFHILGKLLSMETPECKESEKLAPMPDSEEQRAGEPQGARPEDHYLNGVKLVSAILALTASIFLIALVTICAYSMRFHQLAK